MERIRVLLIDPDPCERQGLRHYLEQAGDLVVGEAGEGEEGLHAASRLAPEVALLEVELPGLNGVEVARRLQAVRPRVRVLALSAYVKDEYILGLLDVGAAGYLVKGEPAASIVAAVREAARGSEGLFSQAIACRLADFARCRMDRTAEGGLTVREHEILALMARGWDNGRIAHELYLGKQTVSNYVSRIYSKLGVKSRTEAILHAVRSGLGQ